MVTTRSGQQSFFVTVPDSDSSNSINTNEEQSEAVRQINFFDRRRQIPITVADVDWNSAVIVPAREGAPAPHLVSPTLTRPLYNAIRGDVTYQSNSAGTLFGARVGCYVPN